MNKSKIVKTSANPTVLFSNQVKIVVGVIGVLVLAGVGWFGWATWQNGRDLVETGLAAPSNSASPPNSAPAAAVIGAEVGDVAPDFNIPTLNGGDFTLTEGRGKPTVVLFMAYWCGTCLAEAGALTQLHQEYGDRVSIVSIDVDPSSTPEKLAQFKQAAGNGDFTWAFDAGQKVTAAYEVVSLDTTLIIDAAGQIVYRDQFPTPYQPLKDELVKLGL